MSFKPYWTIGFSGHRHVAHDGVDEPTARAEVKRLIERELEQLLHRTAGRARLAAVSSLACGGDTLFVESVTKLNMPWLCLLPMPEDAFFVDKDFSPEEKRAALTLRSLAYAEEIVCHPIRLADADLPDWRNDAFHSCGITTVDESDIVVVVWRHGETARGKGGTAEMVEYARQRRKPLILIDPSTREVRYLNAGAKEFATDLLVDFDDEVSAALSKLPLPAGIRLDPDASESRQEFDEFEARVAALANTKVPEVRKVSSNAVKYHSIATCLGVAALAFHAIHESAWAHFLLGVVKVCLVGYGFGLLVWLLSKKPHKTAALYRMAAELCRSLSATWTCTRYLYEVYEAPMPAEFRRLARSLAILQRRDRSTSKPDLKTFRYVYTCKRLRHQLNYYRGKVKKAEPWAQRSERAAFVFSLIAVIATGVVVACSGGHLFGIMHGMSEWWVELLSFLMVAMPALASMCVSLIAINEWKRREARYHEMEELLQSLAARFSHAANAAAAEAVAVDTERALLAENFEWYHLAKQGAGV